MLSLYFLLLSDLHLQKLYGIGLIIIPILLMRIQKFREDKEVSCPYKYMAE